MHKLNVLVLGPKNFLSTLDELQNYLKFNIVKKDNNSIDNYVELVDNSVLGLFQKKELGEARKDLRKMIEFCKKIYFCPEENTKPSDCNFATFYTKIFY